MRVMITGANGQVGAELQRQARILGMEYLAVDRDDLDITNKLSIKTLLQEYPADAVINAAAYTAVDMAEDDKESAFQVNADGPANLANACEALNIPLIHYSTDYVFSGDKTDAYTEDDSTKPVNVYGASKLAGEIAVRKYCSKHLIFRTSWVFSSHGHNFVKTMLRLGSERQTLSVVADQYGKPTSASELARITLAILVEHKNKWGMYHIAQPNIVSWYEFANTIFDLARTKGANLKLVDVIPVKTPDYPTRAKRPSNSVLNCDKLETTFGINIQAWRQSLGDVIMELGYTG